MAGEADKILHVIGEGVDDNT
jgi:hypothetical protein